MTHIIQNSPSNAHCSTNSPVSSEAMQFVMLTVTFFIAMFGSIAGVLLMAHMVMSGGG